MQFKTKDELDELTSYEEVIEYRRSIIRRDDYRQIDGPRYIEEVELYADLRFKEVYMKRLDNYRDIIESNKGDKDTIEMMKLIIGNSDNE
jgi:hypothetical protein